MPTILGCDPTTDTKAVSERMLSLRDGERDAIQDLLEIFINSDSWLT